MKIYFFLGFLLLSCARPNYVSRPTLTQDDELFLRGVRTRSYASATSDHTLELRWIHFPVSHADPGELEAQIRDSQGANVGGRFTKILFYMPSMRLMKTTDIELPTDIGTSFRLKPVEFSMNPDWEFEFFFRPTDSTVDDHFIYSITVNLP